MSSATTETDTPYAESLDDKAKLPGRFLATDMKVTGQPLDPAHMGRIIKPRELVDIRLYEMVERRIGLIKQHEEFSVDEFRAMLGVPEGTRLADVLVARRSISESEILQICG